MKKLLLGSMILAAMSLTACSGGKAAASKSMNQGSVGSPHIILSNMKAELEKESNGAIQDYSVTIAGKSYPKAQNVNLRAFGQGFSQQPYTNFIKYTDKASNTSAQAQGKGTMYLFQQQHSAIAAVEINEFHIKTGANQEPQVVKNHAGEDVDLFIVGETTKQLPASGEYHYQGEAHLGNGKSKMSKGAFDYRIDFGKRTGQGAINHQGNAITLKPATITQYTHTNDDATSFTVFGVDEGVAQLGSRQGEYRLGIFGANANEVIGFVDVDDYAGIMGGTKK